VRSSAQVACRGIQRDVDPQRCERCCVRGQVERGACPCVCHLEARLFARAPTQGRGRWEFPLGLRGKQEPCRPAPHLTSPRMRASDGVRGGGWALGVRAAVRAARHLAVERLCHTPPARTRATCGTRRCCGGFRSQHAFARHARVLGQEVGLGVRVLGPLTADTAEAGGSGIMSYRRYKLHAWPLNVAKGLEEQTHRNPRRARVHS